MITVIYGTKNGTQDSIAWWLCQQPGIGPQVYTGPNFIFNNKADEDSGLVNDAYRHDEHTECHRLMENIRGDTIAPMRPLEKDYDMLVWSNYFGNLKYYDQKIECDKLIVCHQSPLEDCFQYVMAHAFTPMTKEDVDGHSELWWTDHKLVNGEVTDSWKEVWYSKYHQKMHDAFDNGTLKYMWQLNFMHWDLHENILAGNDIPIEMEDADNVKRLLLDKILDYNENMTDVVIDYNPGSLLIEDPHWFKGQKPQMILDYLDINWSPQLRDALEHYEHAYWLRREWFDDLVRKTLY